MTYEDFAYGGIQCFFFSRYICYISPKNSLQRYGYVAYTPPSSADFSKQLSDISSRAPELHHALVAHTGLLPDPKSIAEALSHDGPDSTLWKLSIDDEFQSLIDKGVYAKVLLPPGARSIGTRPLFVTKRDGTKKTFMYRGLNGYCYSSSNILQLQT